MKQKKKKQTNKIYGQILRKYDQKSIRDRILALFKDNLNKIITREQIIQVSKDPITEKVPENWHQRLSELRTDFGYTILSWRNRGYLRIEEYVMPDLVKRKIYGKRIKPSDKTWLKILKRSNYACEWKEAGQVCGLKDGVIDPVGGGTVKITPDHKTPHSTNSKIDPNNPNHWQALCGRHQVIKKNYWDNTSGKLNILAILQAASRKEKIKVFQFLINYFEYKIKDKNLIK